MLHNKTKLWIILLRYIYMSEFMKKVSKWCKSFLPDCRWWTPLRCFKIWWACYQGGLSQRAQGPGYHLLPSRAQRGLNQRGGVDHIVRRFWLNKRVMGELAEQWRATFDWLIDWLKKPACVFPGKAAGLWCWNWNIFQKFRHIFNRMYY